MLSRDKHGTAQEKPLISSMLGYLEAAIDTNHAHRRNPFFGLIALFWLTYGLKTAYGSAKLPWLKSFGPAQNSDLPRAFHSSSLLATKKKNFPPLSPR